MESSRIIVSAPCSPSSFPLDFGLWILDLDLGPGFWTWILDLDLGLDLGLTIHDFIGNPTVTLVVFFPNYINQSVGSFTPSTCDD